MSGRYIIQNNTEQRNIRFLRVYCSGIKMVANRILSVNFVRRLLMKIREIIIVFMKNMCLFHILYQFQIMYEILFYVAYNYNLMSQTNYVKITTKCSHPPHSTAQLHGRPSGLCGRHAAFYCAQCHGFNSNVELNVM